MQSPDTLSTARLELERKRTRVSRALFVAAAGLSFLASVYLWFQVDRDQGLFVGLWVPSILALGSLLMAGNGRES